MSNDFEQREFVRIPVKVDVAVELISNGERRAGTTECVSMKGCFIECAESFPKGSLCHITLLIGGPGSETKVWVKGKVASASDTGMGIQIISHLCLESYGHLYRLVLYNAADNAERIDLEIQNKLRSIGAQNDTADIRVDES